MALKTTDCRTMKCPSLVLVPGKFGYHCAITGSPPPFMEREPEGCPRSHPCEGCLDMSDCTLALTPDRALEECTTCKDAHKTGGGKP